MSSVDLAIKRPNDGSDDEMAVFEEESGDPVQHQDETPTLSPNDVDFITSHFFSRSEIQPEVGNEVTKKWPWTSVSTDPDQIDESTFEPVRRIAVSGVPFGPPHRYYRRYWKGFVFRLLQRAADHVSVPIQ
jgi:hypothetical protein